MPKKNDLSALKPKKPETLKKASEQPAMATSRKRGPRKKSAEEKESFAVGLRFTEAQGEALRQVAGDVPLATYLKKKLMQDEDLRHLFE
jgi:hypothetical protein